MKTDPIDQSEVEFELNVYDLIGDQIQKHLNDGLEELRLQLAQCIADHLVEIPPVEINGHLITKTISDETIQRITRATSQFISARDEVLRLQNKVLQLKGRTSNG